MFEYLNDKVRFYELDPQDPAWVHTIEISNEVCGSNFITLWTCNKTPALLPGIEPLLKAGLVLDEHDPAVFHADDQVYAWMEGRYPGKAKAYWRLHYHWPFDHVPSQLDVANVLDRLGDAVSDGLRFEITQEFVT